GDHNTGSHPIPPSGALLLGDPRPSPSVHPELPLAEQPTMARGVVSNPVVAVGWRRRHHFYTRRTGGDESGGIPYVGDADSLSWRRSSLTAASTAPVRVRTPNLPRMAETWWPTVLGERKRRAAISRFDAPCASKERIPNSRPVRRAGLARVAGRGP